MTINEAASNFNQHYMEDKRLKIYSLKPLHFKRKKGNTFNTVPTLKQC